MLQLLMDQLWQPLQAWGGLQPQRRQQRQGQAQHMLPLPKGQAHFGSVSSSRQGYPHPWQAQVHCWRPMQAGTSIPALWIASVRCYKEGGRIKHRWLHKLLCRKAGWNLQEHSMLLPQHAVATHRPGCLTVFYFF